MINRTGKGTHTELLAKKLLEEEYKGKKILIWKTMRNKWCDLDFFSLFDVVCKIPFRESSTVYTRYIQIKTNCNDKIGTLVNRKMRLGISLMDYAINYMYLNESVEIWNFRNARLRGRGSARKQEPAKWQKWRITATGEIQVIE